MARNTEPRLIAPDNLEEPERTSLALFLGLLQEHASSTAAAINSYRSPNEIIAGAQQEAEGTVSRHILEIAGPIFEAGVDLDVDVDPETALAMRRGIEREAREGNSSPQRRRVLRMAIFAGQVAAWQETQSLMEHVADEPTAMSQAPAYPQHNPAVIFMDNPLPETA